MVPHAPGLDDPVEPPPKVETYDVGVIGLGPAGVTAATELVRYGYSVVAIERAQIGGLIHKARAVDNFPGIPPSSPGLTVVDMLWEHMGGFPPKVLNETVTGIYHTGVGYGISFGDSSINAKALILATGTHPKKLGVPGEDREWVHHMWTDVKVDKGSLVAVIGGGDLAVDQALSLHDAGSEIIMILRSGEPRCNMVLQTEMEVAKRFDVITGFEILRFEDREGHTVVYSDGGGENKLEVDAVLVSIGRNPALPLLNDQPMSLNKAIYLATEGLFLAGDIVSERRRQVAIAMGSGLNAAMRCDEYFRRLRE
jgi:thioredoxin reductase (NADPH)